MEDNVIDLNKFKEKNNNNNEVSYTLDDTEYYNDISISVTYDILDILSEDYGYNFNNNPDSMYDIMFVSEAISSLLQSNDSLYHPLQDTARQVIKIESPEETLKEFMED